MGPVLERSEGRGAGGEGSDQLTPAEARFQIEQRRQERIRQRILGIRASDRTMPVKEIAYRVGVSLDVVEQALGVKAAPEVVNNSN
jgi:hypothetical protein